MMDDFDAPPMLPIPLDLNGQPWENKPSVKIQDQLSRMEMSGSERYLLEGALAEQSWMKLIERLNILSLSDDDKERRSQIISFIERNII